MGSKNIQCISDKYLCSACGACNAVCNKDAITFLWSTLGRKYATIDTNKCVNCGMCLKACPSVDTLNLHSRYDNMYVGKIINTYTGRAVDDRVYKNAQSGGVCTAIIQYLIETQKIDCAIMCKMIADKTPQVNAVVIDNSEQLYSCQKSCYTFVDVLTALKSTKQKKSIAIVGVPCHIEGATLLFEQFKQFSNITYKIGLICDRTQCKGMQDTLVSIASGKNNIIQWRKKDFRYKKNVYDYQNAPCVILDEKLNIRKNGVLPNTYRLALKDMFTTPRCRVCYDKLNTHADIVLGDPWGMNDIDWQHGESLVLTRTEKGRLLISEALENKILSLNKRKDFSEVISGQHIDVKQQQTENYISAYNKRFTCPDAYFGTLHFDDTNMEALISEFETFIVREHKTEKQNEAEAKSIIKAMSSNSSFFFQIKNSLKRRIKYYKTCE